MAEDAAAFLAKAQVPKRAPSQESIIEGRDNHDADDYNRSDIINAKPSDDTLPESVPKI